jgi:hypothetical protein
MTFNNWVSYSLSNGTFGMAPFGGGTITVGASVSSTYGSDYFADGSTSATRWTWALPATANTILFSHLDTGTLRITGPMGGTGSLTLLRAAGASNNRGVYFDNPNGGYTGAVTITTGTSARLLCTPFGPDGRTGLGTVTLNGGEFHILSDLAFVPPAPAAVHVGSVRHESDPLQQRDDPRGSQLHARGSACVRTGNPAVIGTPAAPAFPGGPGGSITVDNPTLIGGTNAASITFTADNGYNFGTYNLVLGNSPPVAAVGTRTVTVDNGSRREGYAGQRAAHRTESPR